MPLSSWYLVFWSEWRALNTTEQENMTEILKCSTTKGVVLEAAVTWHKDQARDTDNAHFHLERNLELFKSVDWTRSLCRHWETCRTCCVLWTFCISFRDFSWAVFSNFAEFIWGLSLLDILPKSLHFLVSVSQILDTQYITYLYPI